MTDTGQPVALIMRIRFYQQIGTLYGFTLYMGCSIELIMDGSLLVKATGCFRPQQRF
ncbi:hypothetical protein [Paenibacillus graminis]|uniref:hypothetical protein n=1 Tax=Paenibacillus graminis TaxID=189425 RepID=UPI0030C9559C